MNDRQLLQHRRGFTLIELLVVIAILGIIAALFFPAMCSARPAARKLQCLNHLRHLGQGLSSYHEMHGTFPPGAISKTSYGWSAHLLPHVDLGALEQKIDLMRQPMASREYIEENWLAIFLCPTSEAPHQVDHSGFGLFSRSDYRGVAGRSYAARDGMLFPTDDAHPPVTLDDVTDGTANTLMVGETHLPNTWTSDGNPTAFAIWAGTNGRWENTLGTVAAMPNGHAFDGFGSPHEGGTHFVFADGRVKFLSDDIDSDIYRALGTRSGGEPEHTADE